MVICTYFFTCCVLRTAQRFVQSRAGAGKLPDFPRCYLVLCLIFLPQRF